MTYGLATPITSSTVVASASDVYFSSEFASAILSYPAGSFTGATPTYLGTLGSGSLATNDGVLYFAHAGEIEEFQLPAGQASTFVSGLEAPVDLTLGAGAVYWTDAEGAINGALFDGGPATTFSGGGYQLARDSAGAAGIAADATQLYWANSQSGEILSYTLGTFFPSPNVLASGQGQVFSVAVANDTVYWAGTGSGEICSIQVNPDGGIVDGGSIQVLASNQSLPYAVLLDSTYIYWTNQGTGKDGGSIMRALLDGGSITTIAAAMNQPQAIAVNANTIYWINSGDGTLWQASPK